MDECLIKYEHIIEFEKPAQNLRKKLNLAEELMLIGLNFGKVSRYLVIFKYSQLPQQNFRCSKFSVIKGVDNTYIF